MNGIKVAALIPARGGSKRIPLKNLLDLNGKPLIAYAIQTGLAADGVERVYVTSDHPEILDRSVELGARTILRPDDLASDTARSSDVVRHAMAVMENDGFSADAVILLQPTAPFRSSQNIEAALRLFVEERADTVISVQRRKLGPEWILHRHNNYLSWLLPNDYSRIRGQDQEEFFEINGAIYIYARSVIESGDAYLFGKQVLPYVMGARESFDIDEPEDIEIAESMMRKH